MKNALLTTLLVCALAVSVAPPSHAFGVHGILWMPDDVDDTGIGVGTRWGLRSLGPFTLEARASWIHFGDASMDVFPFEAGLTANKLVNDRVGLYAGATIGYWILTEDALSDNLGATILGGINYATGNVLWYGEFQYVFLDSEINDTDIDVNLDGFQLNIGVQFGNTARIKQESDKK